MNLQWHRKHRLHLIGSNGRSLFHRRNTSEGPVYNYAWFDWMTSCTTIWWINACQKQDLTCCSRGKAEVPMRRSVAGPSRPSRGAGWGRGRVAEAEAAAWHQCWTGSSVNDETRRWKRSSVMSWAVTVWRHRHNWLAAHHRQTLTINQCRALRPAHTQPARQLPTRR